MSAPQLDDALLDRLMDFNSVTGPIALGLASGNAEQALRIQNTYQMLESKIAASQTGKNFKEAAEKRGMDSAVACVFYLPMTYLRSRLDCMSSLLFLCLRVISLNILKMLRDFQASEELPPMPLRLSKDYDQIRSVTFLCIWRTKWRF